MGNKSIIIFLVAIAFFSSCKKDPEASKTTPYELVRPYKFPVFPNDNEKNLTEEGIALGRMLFYDPILSVDSSMACATCHVQADGFSDKRKFSIGVDGSIGTIQAMPLMNLVWGENFFWDGRSIGLANQALEPVENPIEMKAHWDIVIDKLINHPVYAQMFDDAFPGKEITKELATDAIAQFEKTLISANSKFDKDERGEYEMTDSELRGKIIFYAESGNCFHCHETALFTNFGFQNNGLDSVYSNLGLENVTGNIADRGKFKIPTLRNIEVTAPYMFDGRYNTLDEVIEFYQDHVVLSENVDVNIVEMTQDDLVLTTQDKIDLKAFLLTLTDHEFLSNPKFASPF